MEINNMIKNKIEKYINGFDIIYWINLDRSAERRTNMIEMLSYFPVQNIRISAIDGKEASDSKIQNMFITNNYGGSKVEFACLASHLNTIRIFSESSYSIALILEDDMTLEFSKYWMKDINSIINEAPPDWDIIMLSYIWDSAFNNTYTLNNGIWGTGAYLINMKGAKKLMRIILENNKFKLYNRQPTADGFIYSMMKTYIYKFPYFTKFPYF